MARLIYVPVVHSIEEMGSAALEYRAAFIARYGEAEWAERTAKFEKIWVGIVKAIEAMRLNLSNVKVYQDSLPICGHERELVKDLAVKGSRNHQLLEKLMQGGATLVGHGIAQSSAGRVQAPAVSGAYRGAGRRPVGGARHIHRQTNRRDVE